MKRIGLTILAATLNAAILSAQTQPQPSATLAIRSGLVELERGDVWTAITPGVTLRPGDRIRTASGSTAAIQFEKGGVVTLNQQSQVQIGNPGASPLIQLENGSMKVFSPSDMQLQAKDTTLEVADRPLDLELGYQADSLNLTIFNGSVRSGPVTIRGGNQDPTVRTYTAGGRLPRNNEIPVTIPNFYVYPYFMYGNGNAGNRNAGGIVAPVVNNPTHPGYRPTQIVPPMSDPIRVPVNVPVNQ